MNRCKVAGTPMVLLGYLVAGGGEALRRPQASLAPNHWDPAVGNGHF